jgi:hypothetical protein
VISILGLKLDGRIVTNWVRPKKHLEELIACFLDIRTKQKMMLPAFFSIVACVFIAAVTF